jgi:tetraacyldisaccharide 4'-kinase
MKNPFLQCKIAEVVSRGNLGDPAFVSPLEFGLYICSLVYEMAVKSRLHLYNKGVLRQKRLPCKVVSVGNLTVGGTGKTPVVEYIAHFLKGLGINVAVISRGYGGHAERSGGIVSNGKTMLMQVKASGDEPQLLASKLKGIPVLVGKNRYLAGQQAVTRFGSSVLILDDGFQHLPLKRDVNLLLLDSARPFGNGHCTPRGPLREPIEQVKRASAFVLTRWPGGNSSVGVVPMIETHAGRRPIFRCVHAPSGLFSAYPRESLDLRVLRRKRVFLFSGIARNDSFREAIDKLEGCVVGWLAFPDHHRYSDKDLKAVWTRAKDLHADSIVTTEKDFVNIDTEIPPAPRLMILKITISFGEDKTAFESYLKTEITQ